MAVDQNLQNKTEMFQLIFPRLSDAEKKDWEDNFRVEFTHDSTSIEGNTLTLIETKMILEDKIVPAETSLKELDEVRGHADAWDFVRESVSKGIPLTENIIRDIHERVLPVKGVGGFYRKIPVYIRGAQHVPPNPIHVWDYMKNFDYQIQHRAFPDDIEKAAWIHAELVKIHPFQDGNGRTARLTMNYHLMNHGYPPTSIKKKNREEYFKTLEEYALHENIQPFKQLLIENMNREMDSFLTMHSYSVLSADLDGHPDLQAMLERYREMNSAKEATQTDGR